MWFEHSGPVPAIYVPYKQDLKGGILQNNDARVFSYTGVKMVTE